MGYAHDDYTPPPPKAPTLSVSEADCKSWALAGEKIGGLYAIAGYAVFSEPERSDGSIYTEHWWCVDAGGGLHDPTGFGAMSRVTLIPLADQRDDPRGVCLSYNGPCNFATQTPAEKDATWALETWDAYSADGRASGITVITRERAKQAIAVLVEAPDRSKCAWCETRSQLDKDGFSRGTLNAAWRPMLASLFREQLRLRADIEALRLEIAKASKLRKH